MRVALAVALALAVPAVAQQQEPVVEPPPPPPGATPTAASSQERGATAPVDPPTAGRVRVTAPAGRTSRTPKPAAALPEPWNGVRAVRIEEDQAVLRFSDGGERTLRPGDRLAEAMVREIGDGVVVLDREAVAGQLGGAARIIVRFDAAGNPRVRTIYEEDPTKVEPPEVR